MGFRRGVVQKMGLHHKKAKLILLLGHQTAGGPTRNQFTVTCPERPNSCLDTIATIHWSHFKHSLHAAAL
jgi:hypothetical protein